MDGRRGATPPPKAAAREVAARVAAARGAATRVAAQVDMAQEALPTAVPEVAWVAAARVAAARVAAAWVIAAAREVRVLAAPRLLLAASRLLAEGHPFRFEWAERPPLQPPAPEN